MTTQQTPGSYLAASGIGGGGYDSDGDVSSSSSSSSSSDDDEYLTVGRRRNGGGGAGGDVGPEDREAMIRRKLLESFYGDSSAAMLHDQEDGSNNNNNKGNNASSSQPNDGSPDRHAPGNASTTTTSFPMTPPRRNTNSNANAMQQSTSTSTSPNHITSQSSNSSPNHQNQTNAENEDLDSPSFQAKAHTKTHIQSHTTHTLLQTDETLSQSIRLLDSTMQTLVYENYSKFIDATDAIRNIGLSVHVSKEGLETLQKGMESMEGRIQSMDSSLRTSREAVAEKLRVKRLLTRLTRLLELPNTLQELQKTNRYRLAMRNYYDAISILEKHSDGFESLMRIQGECGTIVENMIGGLEKKVWVWCSATDIVRGQRQLKQQLLKQKQQKYDHDESDNDDRSETDDYLQTSLVRSQSNAATQEWGRATSLSVLDELFASGRFMSNFQKSNKDKIDTFDEDDLSNDNESDDDDDDKYMDLMIPTTTSMMEMPPPQSISEIFECTGALLVYSNSFSSPQQQSAQAEEQSKTLEITEMECKSLALECCTKYLESILEDHAVDVQEAKFRALAVGNGEELKHDASSSSLGAGRRDSSAGGRAGGITTNTAGATGGVPATPSSSSMTPVNLVPNRFLDSLLEAATLYGVTFRSSSLSDMPTTPTATTTTTASTVNSPVKMTTEDSQLLSDYVSIWFGSFLAHVRMVLLEYTFDREESTSYFGRSTSTGTASSSAGVGKLNNNNNSNETKTAEGYEQDEEEDDAFAEVSNALMLLLRSVRELASGLALPEIGLDMEVASSLVEKTVGVTEAMVRRRVEHKFEVLKIKVLRDCIEPFVRDAIESGSNTSVALGASKSVIMATVQMANVSLSDGMQLVEDTIRSLLSSDSAVGSPSDSGMVKVAVRKNARKFAVWLAQVLECIAGCEVSDKQLTLEVRPSAKSNGQDINVDGKDSKCTPPNHVLDFDHRMENEVSNDNNGSDGNHKKRKDQIIISDICTYLQERASDSSLLLFTLTVAEMCCMAERKIAVNMNQSIMSATEDEAKAVLKGSELFSTNVRKDPNKLDTDGVISLRFKLAASRIMTLYASIRGEEAVGEVCQTIFETCYVDSDFFPRCPTEAVCKMLEVVKQSCLECADAFADEKMAGPVPSFMEEEGTNSGGGDYFPSAGTGGAMKGLQLDVARMFTEKVQVYPYSSEIIGVSTNSVVSMLLKIACKAWTEQVRHCAFTSFSYRQMQVDAEFVRFMLPHYVKEEDVDSISNLLNDLILNTGERCVDVECVGVTEYYDEVRRKVMTPLSIVMTFLGEEEAAGGKGILDQFVIQEEEEHHDDDDDFVEGDDINDISDEEEE